MNRLDFTPVSTVPLEAQFLMAIGIDPLVDFAAKRLLGSPEHSRITLHFLNSVLRFTNRILEVTILNPINMKEFEVDKLSILDIRAMDSVGRRYNIEVQTTRPLGLPKRLTYYAAKQLVEQLGEGDHYADLNPSISICLLDAIMFPVEPELHQAFALRTASGLSLTDCLQVHVIELPKYVIPSDNEPITDPVDQWLYFFREAPRLTAAELARRLSDPVFAEATGVLEMIARTPAERQAYEDRLKAERDEWARTEQARREGKAEGKIEGKIEERVRVVKMLRDLVGDTEPADESLHELSLDELASIETEFQRRLRERT